MTVSDPFEYDPFEKLEVRKALERFLTKERYFIQGGLDNAAVYLPIVHDIFSEEGLPGELVYLPLIESAFSVRAYSRAGASGLWQFMPGTARVYNLTVDFWVDERRDPFKSTVKAAKHLKDLFYNYNSWELALAAYNAGMGSINYAISRGRTRDYWKLCSMGLLKRETREYVPRFIAAAHIAKNPEKYGFQMEKGVVFPEFEILNVEKPVDLTILGEKTGISYKSLQYLNPELRRMVTPLGRKYKLRVPREKFPEVLNIYLSLPMEEIVGVKSVTVRSGETLSEIALRNNTSITFIKQINNISDSKRIFAGAKILIPVHSESANPVEYIDYVPKKGFKTQEILYTIKTGDTLWDIAQRYRSDVETILAVNGLSFESIIKPGDEIKIWIETPLQR